MRGTGGAGTVTPGGAGWEVVMQLTQQEVRS